MQEHEGRRFFSIRVALQPNMDIRQYAAAIYKGIKEQPRKAGSDDFNPEADMDDDLDNFEIIGVNLGNGDEQVDQYDADINPEMEDPDFREYFLNAQEAGLIDPADPLAIVRSHFTYRNEISQ